MSEMFETTQKMGELQREVARLQGEATQQHDVVADGVAAVARCEELEEKLATMSSELARTPTRTHARTSVVCVCARPQSSGAVPRPLTPELRAVCCACPRC
eukprot:COSAG01_NODE_17091_length_1179_cov_7.442097_2_plen_101_part_00